MKPGKIIVTRTQRYMHEASCVSRYCACEESSIGPETPCVVLLRGPWESGNEVALVMGASGALLLDFYHSFAFEEEWYEM